NTVALAEALGGLDQADARGFIWGDQAAFQFLFAELAPNSRLPDRCPNSAQGCRSVLNTDRFRPWAAAATGTETCAARSLHSGGVHVLLADGSARFVSDNIDLATWRAILTIGSGDTIGDFSALAAITTKPQPVAGQMHASPSLTLWVGFWLACAVSLAGCSQGTQAAVSGKVTLDGSPLDDATVSFVPMTGGQRSAAWAAIRDGRYTISASSGLGIGRFRVEIRALRSTGGKINQNDPTLPAPAREAVPARYNSKSELFAEIKPGDNVADFKLKSK